MFNIRFLLALAFITMPLWMGLIMGTVVLLEQKYEAIQRYTKKE